MQSPYILLIFGCLCSAFGYPEVTDGSICDSDDGTDGGECRAVVDCEPAKEALRKSGRHDFKRCGFRGWNEIVCCPIETATNSAYYSSSSSSSERFAKTTSESSTQVRGPLTRKSYRACEELSNEIGPKLSYQILGGVDAQLGEFPHMAALGYANDEVDGGISWQCGGALISKYFVLTAAHCIAKQDNNPPVKIRLGKVDISEVGDNSESDYSVSNYSIHPQFNRRLKLNDIALIRLSRPVTNNENINPACLYHKSDDPAVGLVITGWGLTRLGGDSSLILQKGFLQPVSVSKCNESYTSAPLGRTISRNQICAISGDGKTDACQGDSGGPLQIQSMHSSSVYSIVGVTSFGRGCGGTYPGVYARVYSYLDWIEGIVWPN